MGAQPAYSHRSSLHAAPRSTARSGSVRTGRTASASSAHSSAFSNSSYRTQRPYASADARTRSFEAGASYARAFDGSAARVLDAQPESDRSRGARIRVVAGAGPQNASAALPASAHMIAKIAVVVIAVFVLVGVARVFLSSASVSASVEAKELTSMIDSARAQGNQLEVAQSSLSNPARVKSEANAMGMAAPSQTTVITLDDDVVAVDSAGNLSLSKTLQSLASGAGA